MTMSPASDFPAPRPGSILHLALLSADALHRPGLAAWAAWWHEVSQIPYTVSDPSVADRKLGWWQQAVADGFAQPPQHPLLRALLMPQGRLDAHGVPPMPLWLEQLKGLQALTQQTRWMDEATLVAHMNATTGAACQGAAWMLGATSADAGALARQLGVGLRRAHILARLGQDAQHGWLHIPIDVLQRHGVRAHELLRPLAPLPGPDIQALLAAWAAQARQEIDAALAGMRAAPLLAERRALKPLAVLAKLHTALLEDLAQAGYPVLRQRMMLGPWRKWRATQAARWGWR